MQDWLDAYGESHQNPVNKGFHWLCVPVIFFTIIGLLSLIPTGFSDVLNGNFPGPYLHFGALVILLGVLFFLRLSVSIAAGMLVFSVLVLYFVHAVNLAFPGNAVYIYLILFVLAWIGQFIGHKIEGKKPSFFDDLKFLLIGPAWLLHFVYRKLGIRY
jgi:uncharacterized membrane protein YGL010W